MASSIYSPSVQREAQLLGITDLQAYRMAQTREILRGRERAARREKVMAYSKEVGETLTDLATRCATSTLND